MWPTIVMAGVPSDDPGPPRSSRTPSGSEGGPPTRRPFEIAPGVRTAILFGLGIALTIAQSVAYIGYGQEPNYLLVSITVASLGLPLFLGLPGGGSDSK